MNYTSITLGELLSSENETIKRNAISILKVLQKHDLYHTYKDAQDYQIYLRKNGNPHDYVIVNGILFTQDEYDMSGKEITYGNLKKKKSMTITTSDRYKDGFEDAVVEIDELYSWRNDINYAE